MGDKKSKVFLYDDSEIKKLYSPYFEIIETRDSRSNRPASPVFSQYLMKLR